ncbi:hypothetical protein PspLS_09192 [Pyricularia sp. CBS 133598]|nr:hypothetical protein PspLS_09192 [Pyricularia sp. CBS 133598]
MLVSIIAAIAATVKALYDPKTKTCRRRCRRQDRSRRQQALTWQPWSRPLRPVRDLEAGRGRGAATDDRSPPPYDAQQPRKWQHIRRWQLGVASDTGITAVDGVQRDGFRLSPLPRARLAGSRGWNSV